MNIDGDLALLMWRAFLGLEPRTEDLARRERQKLLNRY